MIYASRARIIIRVLSIFNENFWRLIDLATKLNAPPLPPLPLLNHKIYYNLLFYHTPTDLHNILITRFSQHIKMNTVSYLYKHNSRIGIFKVSAGVTKYVDIICFKIREQNYNIFRKLN